MAKASKHAPFEGFDLSKFWEGTGEYGGGTLTAELLRSVESELGVALPASYVALMRVRNGGLPRNACFRTTEGTSWAEDHVAITGIFGIGRRGSSSLCGKHGATFWHEEWGYPRWALCVCDCPSAGHDMVALDYRKGKGEPEVVHIDQESGYKVTFLAPDFETFIRGLVNESEFDTAADDLAADLRKVESGSFSTLLAKLIAASKDPSSGTTLRNVLRALTEEKGYLALHADARSVLVYDMLFHLYTSARKVKSGERYLKAYPDMLVFGDGGLTTGGYAPGFVATWFARRLKRGDIVVRGDGSLGFSGEFVEKLKGRMRKVGR